MKREISMKRTMKRLAVCLLAVALLCSGCGLVNPTGEVAFMVVARDESETYTSYFLRRSERKELSGLLVRDGFLLWEDTESGQMVTTVNGEYADAVAGEYWSVTKNDAVFAGPWEQVEAVDGDVYELVFTVRP